MATTPAPKDAQFLRTRKMLTFLPVAGIPFLAFLFGVNGGGQGQSATAAPVQMGLNLDLPKAQASTLTTSKLAAYSAPVDSLRNRELTAVHLDTARARGLAYGLSGEGPSGNARAAADKAAAAAQQQLLAVQQAQRGNGQVAATPATSLTPQEQLEVLKAQHKRDLEEQRTQLQIERLNAQAMAASSQGGRGEAASAPRRAPSAPAAPKERAPKTRAAVVDADAVVSHLGSDGADQKVTASFRGIDADTEAGHAVNTLPAVIHESQEVVSGSLIKMRLTEPAVVNGHRLPANTFIYGVCALTGERLRITIESLKSGESIFPADLAVFDVDGLEGLHIPGTISRDAVKQAGAEGLGAADMMTMSPNAATAAAGVAISAAKGIGQKKLRLVTVRLKAGYNVLLKVDKDH